MTLASRLLCARDRWLVFTGCRNSRIYASMKIQPERMLTAADRASELLRSLGNRHRLLILCQLVDGEKSVGELVKFLGIRDSTVSQHLQWLRKDGLVKPRRDGQTIWYSISSAPARDLVEVLYRSFCKPGAGRFEKPVTARRRRY